MEIIYIVLGIILLLAIAIVLLPVRVMVEYSDRTTLKIFVYGIKVYDMANKKSDKTESSSEVNSVEENKPDDKAEVDYIALLKENFELLKEILKQIVEKTQKYVIIKNIEARYRFGLGDAAVTGIFSGVVYGVVNGFAAFVRNYYKIENQKLEVVPDFDNKVQEFKGKIEIVIRVMFFVPVLLKLLKIFKRKEEV